MMVETLQWFVRSSLLILFSFSFQVIVWNIINQIYQNKALNDRV